MNDSQKQAADEINDDQLEQVSGGTAIALTTTTRRAGGTEDINIGVGELQECTISKSLD